MSTKFSLLEGRGCVDQIFTFRLIIEKFLSYQTPLVLSFIGYEQTFNSVDRRALAKVLSLLVVYQTNQLKGLVLCTRIILLRLR